ncbi:MAG: V-type ATP synthase subunit F [Actinomycetota bacterium]|nr:V-type ATP synthase subunit F [Actinomycetota bacterium]
MKVRIAAFGEKDIMLIFKSAGVDVFPLKSGAEEVSEIEKKLRQLIKDGYGIIFITETIAFKLDNLIKEYEDKFQPSIIVIPGLGERNDYALKNLKRIIVKAVGADIMSGKEYGRK